MRLVNGSRQIDLWHLGKELECLVKAALLEQRKGVRALDFLLSPRPAHSVVLHEALRHVSIRIASQINKYMMGNANVNEL